MSNMPPWSFSTLTSYETCPKRHYLTKVTYAIKEPMTQALIWGNEVHAALEKRAKTGEALSPAFKAYEPVVDKLISVDGQRLVEESLALDSNFQIAPWKKSWVRGKIDLGIINNETAYLYDYKTGSRKPESDQLKLMALLTFHTYQYVDRIKTGFIWLKEGKLDSEVFTRQQVPVLWQEFLPRIKRLENAFATEKWEPKPSGLCKSWCPCTGCEFNGKYSGKA